MAAGESGLQIHLQPALCQGRLPDLAPSQSGTLQGGEAWGLGRRATAGPVWPYLGHSIWEGVARVVHHLRTQVLIGGKGWSPHFQVQWEQMIFWEPFCTLGS